jgi:hypothetical protein
MVDINGVHLKIISYRSSQHYGSIYHNGELIDCIQGESRQEGRDKAQSIAGAQIAEAARAVVRYAGQDKINQVIERERDRALVNSDFLR